MTAESGLLFHLTPIFLGISVELNMESNLLSSLMLNGSSCIIFFRESEDIIKFLLLLQEMMSYARSIAAASFEKIELSLGIAYLIMYL